MKHLLSIADLSREAAEKVAADIDGIGVPLDVTDPDSVAAAVAETTERLVRTAQDLGRYLRDGDETALATARDRLDRLRDDV